MKTVLLTGATGLIGSHILPILKENEFRIHLLSRSSKLVPYADAVFKWNPEEGEMDEQALDGVTHLIHLAGAGIADKHWTHARKKEIIQSRVQSAALIHQLLQKRKQQLEVLVSASAIGWYGAISDDRLHVESEPAAQDFLGETCRLWEHAADEFKDVAKRIVKLRTGVVLAKESGALPQLLKPFQFYAGSPLGTGKQQIQWIHITDIARIYSEACCNETWEGTYNASATEECSNRLFAKELAKASNKPLLPISVPSFVLKLLLGEMSAMVLEGSRVSNKKLIDTGFQFQFTELSKALKNLIN